MSTAEIGCTVLIDGAPISDGCTSLDPDVPAVLSGLRITWGRSSTVDQPVPSSCVFNVADPLDGPRLVPSLAIGRRVDVRADTVVYPDPTVSTIPVLIPSSLVHVSSAPVAPAGTVTITADGTGLAAAVVFPPLAYTGNPLGWDTVPRTLPGQAWRYRATITPPAAFGGWAGWAGTVQPVTFTRPDGRDATPIGPVTQAGPTVDVTFTPPPGVWLGLRVRMWPTAPAWVDLDATSWAALGAVGTPAQVVAVVGPNTVSSTLTPITLPASVQVGDTITIGYSGIGGVPEPTFPGPGWVQVKPRNTTGNTMWVVYRKTATVAGAQTITLTQATSTTQTALAVVTRGHGDPVYSVATEQLGTLNPPPSIPGLATTGPGQLVSIVTGRVGNTTARGVVTGGATQVAGTPTDPTNNAAIQWVVTSDRRAGSAAAQVVTMTWPTGGTRGGGGITMWFPDVPSTGDPRTWEQLARFVVTGVQLLAPAAGAADSALVFSGRITDVIAGWDGGPDATLQVIAQDWLAELSNRFVGDTPWTVEALGTRAARIVTLSGQPVTLTTDAGVAALPVTYRDVDRQPATALLQQLATSCAGILWTATHLVTGQVMRIEDVAARPAALTLTKNGTVHVVPSPAALAHSLPVTACNVDAEPVRFLMDMTDTVSIVAATWLEQTTDPGPPVTQRPTQRTVEVTAPNTLALIGARRLSVSTQLTTLPDGTATANKYLARSSVVAWRIEGLTWDTAGALAPTDIAAVMRLLDGTRRNGLPIALTDLPDWAGAMTGGQDQVALYVEGGDYTYSAGAWELALNTSAANGSSLGVLPWTALDAAWRWSDFDPAVSWLSLYGVTYPPA